MEREDGLIGFAEAEFAADDKQDSFFTITANFFAMPDGQGGAENLRSST